MHNNGVISLGKNAKRDWGEKSYPIWLLINPKYPSVCHELWRPVLDNIQDRVYREMHTRIDTTNIYIRSAVSDRGIVPNTLNWWGKEVAKEIEFFRQLVSEYKPKLLITFGAFPYEFVRRVFEILPEKGPKAWSTSALREEFKRSMENFDINKTNLIPLLRRVVASDKSIQNFDYSSQTDREAYFHYIGTMLAEKIIDNKDSLNIWLE